MKFAKKKYNFWAIMVAVIVILSLVAVYIQNDSNLTAYTTGDKIEASTTETTTKKIELEKKMNDEKLYSIGIPSDWKKVIKDGYDTYIHTPSATSVQIQTIKYSPQILLTSAQSINAELMNNNCNLISFEWYNSTTYSCVYEKTNENNPTTHIETTYFDKQTTMRLVFTINSKYYNQMKDTIIAIIDSFKWDKSNPFPEGVSLYYSKYGNFEFGYPTDWKIGSTNNAYVAQDEKSGAIMSIRATESAATYASFNKIDYTKYASNGRSNFILQSYNANSNIIYAESTYISNNKQMVLVQYLIASGKHEYTITFEVPQQSFQEQADIIQNVINTFRYF